GGVGGAWVRGRAHVRTTPGDPLPEIPDERRTIRPDAQVPPESVGRAPEAPDAALVHALLVVADAQRDQVPLVVASLPRPEDDVVLVQTAARRATRRHAAPAVPLEDAVAPLPVRIVGVL